MVKDKDNRVSASYTNPAIKVEGITMAYHEKPVIWDIDFETPTGAIMAIIGPNGAGKSTLLKGMLGLMKPLSGKVEILGEEYAKVYKKIAYIPQSSSVNWDFPTTVIDVVLMGRYVHRGWIKRTTKKDLEIAKKALNDIGMSDFAHRQISQLSGGQKQRVFLARAMAQDAQIYFMDEPLQGVDKKTEAIIMEEMFRLQKMNRTIISVHHDLNTVRSYFDHVLILNKKLFACGPTEKVFTKEIISDAFGASELITMEEEA